MQSFILKKNFCVLDKKYLFVGTFRPQFEKTTVILEVRTSEFCNKVFDKHAPIKKRYLRSNHNKPLTKNGISKSIMTKTRLRNLFEKQQS